MKTMESLKVKTKIFESLMDFKKRVESSEFWSDIEPYEYRTALAELGLYYDDYDDPDEMWLDFIKKLNDLTRHVGFLTRQQVKKSFELNLVLKLNSTGEGHGDKTIRISSLDVDIASKYLDMYICTYEADWELPYIDGMQVRDILPMLNKWYEIICSGLGYCGVLISPSILEDRSMVNGICMDMEPYIYDRVNEMLGLLYV